MFDHFDLAMGDDARWEKMKKEMKMEMNEMMDTFMRTMMGQIGSAGGQNGPTGGQSGGQAGQARHGPRDGDPRDATIEGLQTLVRQLQQTIEGLQRQLSSRHDVEHLPGQEYGHQRQQRQQ